MAHKLRTWHCLCEDPGSIPGLRFHRLKICKVYLTFFFYIRQTYPICHQVVNRYLISSTLPLPLVVNYHLSTHVTLAIFECFMPAFLPMPLHLKVKLLFYNSDKDWSNSKLALMFQKSVQLYLPKISIKDLSNMNLLWHI